MSTLQQSRYDRLMRRVGDLKGPGSKVNDVLEELFPTLDVENVPGELLWLMGTRLCHGGGTVAGVALQHSRAQLFNPPGSAKLMTITSVHFAHESTGIVRWGAAPTPLGVEAGTEVFRDTRELPPTAPTGQIQIISTVSLGTGTNQSRLLADTDFLLEDQNGIAVLSPATGWEISTAVPESDINFGILWRERIAEPSELNA